MQHGERMLETTKQKTLTLDVNNSFPEILGAKQHGVILALRLEPSTIIQLT